MKFRFTWLIILLSSCLAVGLSACGSGSAPTAALPLAEGRSTFLFFYTDN